MTLAHRDRLGTKRSSRAALSFHFNDLGAPANRFHVSLRRLCADRPPNGTGTFGENGAGGGGGVRNFARPLANRVKFLGLVENILQGVVLTIVRPYHILIGLEANEGHSRVSEHGLR